MIKTLVERNYSDIVNGYALFRKKTDLRRTLTISNAVLKMTKHIKTTL